jgi:carboxymethylenebutenolidase
MKKFLFLLWMGLTLSAGWAAEPCCDATFRQAAGTAEFAAMHPLKIANERYQSKGYIVKLSDFGAEDVAYLALPERPPLGGIVLIHEWWGLNDFIKAEADKFADLGYEALAVDLYNGKVAADATEASQLMQGLHTPSALKTIEAAVRLLRESPKFKVPKVVTLGWCLGGGISLQAALQVRGVDGVVMYYGPVELNAKKLEQLHVPLCGIFAARDKWVTPAAVQEFQGLLKEMGKENEIHTYDADHAFANPSNAKYDKAKATEARAVAQAFLQRVFSEPAAGPGIIDRIFK